MLTRTVYFLLDLPKKIKTKNIIEPLHNPQSSDSDIGAFKVQKIISHLNFFFKIQAIQPESKKEISIVFNCYRI